MLNSPRFYTHTYTHTKTKQLFPLVPLFYPRFHRTPHPKKSLDTQWQLPPSLSVLLIPWPWTVHPFPHKVRRSNSKDTSRVKTKKTSGRCPTMHSVRICSTSRVFTSIFVLEYPQASPPRHGLPFGKHNAARTSFSGGGCQQKRRTSVTLNAP